MSVRRHRARGREPRGRLLVLCLTLFCAGLLLFFVAAAAHAQPRPATEGPAAAAPPLPADCNELAPPGGTAPPACVYGYVYVDGAPVAGAAVSVRDDAGGLMTTTTAAGLSGPDPYFLLDLSAPPLAVQTGDLLEVTAAAAGKANSTTFMVAAGAQQVDVSLDTTCGGSVVGGGFIVADTLLPRACGPYTVTGNVIIMDGVTLTVEAGTTIRFAAGRSLEAQGVLDARGEANAMVAFTSAEAGAAGDWAYLTLIPPSDPTTKDHLRYALVEYAGGAAISDNGAIRVQGGAPELAWLTVRHNASDGVHFFDDAAGDIDDAAIYDNTGWGIYVDSDVLSVGNFNLDVRDNGGGGIRVDGTGNYGIGPARIVGNDGQGLHVRGFNLAVGVADTLIAGNSSFDASVNWGGGAYVGNGGTLILSSSVIRDNTAGRGGGVGCDYSAKCYLHDNVFLNNEANDRGGAVFFGNGSADNEFSENVVAGNVADDGGGVYMDKNATQEVQHNTFIYNVARERGAAFFVREPRLIQYNAFIDNEGDSAVYVLNEPQFYANHLFNNELYAMENGNAYGTSDVNAEGNWWGTANYSAIEDAAWHQLDDSALGLIDYVPAETGPYLAAPVSPPQGLTLSADGPVVAGQPMTVTLAWDPVQVGDLAGYNVYYDDDEVYPYAGSGAGEGDAPIDAGDVTSYTLTGLAPAGYTFTVTAYDTGAGGDFDQPTGNESWFARAVGLPAPALSPTVAISYAGGDVALSWPRVQTDTGGAFAAITSYEVFTGTAAHVMPTAPAWAVPQPLGGDVLTVHEGGCGNAAANYFYWVRAVRTDGFGNQVISAASAPVGAFNFALVPGSN